MKQAIEARIAKQQAKLRARENTPGYEGSVKMIRQEIERLQTLLASTDA